MIETNNKHIGHTEAQIYWVMERVKLPTTNSPNYKNKISDIRILLYVSPADLNEIFDWSIHDQINNVLDDCTQ
jgi:hypothetical protein